MEVALKRFPIYTLEMLVAALWKQSKVYLHITVVVGDPFESKVPVAATMLRRFEPPKVKVEPTTLRIIATVEFTPLD